MQSVTLLMENEAGPETISSIFEINKEVVHDKKKNQQQQEKCLRRKDKKTKKKAQA